MSADPDAADPNVCPKAASKAAPNAAVAVEWWRNVDQSGGVHLDRSWYNGRGWSESAQGLWEWHGRGTGWWREWQDGYRPSWAAARFVGPPLFPDGFAHNSDNPQEDDVEWEGTLQQWADNAITVSTTTSQNGDVVDETRVAAVAAGGTAEWPQPHVLDASTGEFLHMARAN